MSSATQDVFLIPACEARAEITVLNSRFIACCAPVFDVDQAREYIVKIRREFADATHHVPAFLVGHGSSVTAHCSDDGEPSGTAGRPALAVLKGSGLGDVVVVVTRYFGGTKLGTGGLVRAYGDAVKAVLVVLPKAQKAASHTALIAVPYPQYENIRLLVSAHQGLIVNSQFAADVTLTVRLQVDRFESFQSELSQLSHGQVQAEIIETNRDTILPLAPPPDESGQH